MTCPCFGQPYWRRDLSDFGDGSFGAVVDKGAQTQFDRMCATTVLFKRCLSMSVVNGALRAFRLHWKYRCAAAVLSGRTNLLRLTESWQDIAVASSGIGCSLSGAAPRFSWWWTTVCSSVLCHGRNRRGAMSWVHQVGCFTTTSSNTASCLPQVSQRDPFWGSGSQGSRLAISFSRPQDESDDFEELFCIGQQLLRKSLVGGFNNHVPVPGMPTNLLNGWNILIILKHVETTSHIQPPSYLRQESDLGDRWVCRREALRSCWDGNPRPP